MFSSAPCKYQLAFFNPVIFFLSNLSSTFKTSSSIKRPIDYALAFLPPPLRRSSRRPLVARRIRRQSLEKISLEVLTMPLHLQDRLSAFGLHSPCYLHRRRCSHVHLYVLLFCCLSCNDRVKLTSPSPPGCDSQVPLGFSSILLSWLLFLIVVLSLHPLLLARRTAPGSVVDLHSVPTPAASAAPRPGASGRAQKHVPAPARRGP